MKNNILLILMIVASMQVSAQLVKEKSVNVAIGLGFSYPTDAIDVSGSGFYVQGEYVNTLKKWIDIRPYAGLILTKTNSDYNDRHGTDFKSSANALLIGAKARIMAPIPWVAPYVEIGIGASFGSFETLTPVTNIDKSGVFLHIPWTIGLKLGPNRTYDISFSYYEHPAVKQFSAAAAIGFSFPLKSK